MYVHIWLFMVILFTKGSKGSWRSIQIVVKIKYDSPMNTHGKTFYLQDAKVINENFAMCIQRWIILWYVVLFLSLILDSQRKHQCTAFTQIGTAVQPLLSLHLGMNEGFFFPNLALVEFCTKWIHITYARTWCIDLWFSLFSYQVVKFVKFVD